MADNELQVIINAKKLASHSYKLTSNINHYPKKYRHSLVDEIQKKCLHIHNSLLEANRTDLKDYKRDSYERYNAWKNYALHGNCYKLCQSMDYMVEELITKDR
jgi:cytoplasmic iron level regulating protein YaaA (DUF328/UPF0246 family)